MHQSQLNFTLPVNVTVTLYHEKDYTEDEINKIVGRIKYALERTTMIDVNTKAIQSQLTDTCAISSPSINGIEYHGRGTGRGNQNSVLTPFDHAVIAYANESGIDSADIYRMVDKIAQRPRSQYTEEQLMEMLDKIKMQRAADKACFAIVLGANPDPKLVPLGFDGHGWWHSQSQLVLNVLANSGNAPGWYGSVIIGSSQTPYFACGAKTAKAAIDMGMSILAAEQGRQTTPRELLDM